ncbi:MAG: hypothetical protein IT463_09625 [Planctomycetes bacterium]|nr:hypothetical protein [Planctomycetota bacterium]
MTDANAQASRRNKRLAGGFVALVVAAVIIWLLMQRCHPVETPQGPFPFDYFRVKAEELGRDPVRIKEFVAGLTTLDYQGDRKGPLGCLWDGGGSAEEKALVEDALIQCCDPMVAAPALYNGAATNKAATLDVRLNVERAGGTDAKGMQTTAGALLGNVHSLEFPAENKARLTLRPYRSEPVVIEVDTAGAEALSLSFLEEGGRSSEREFWHRKNRVGYANGYPGDRHDFVVLPARVGKYVREKEELRLKEAGRDPAQDQAAQAYLTLLDWCLDSDAELEKIEKRFAVRAQFDRPRIVFLGRHEGPIAKQPLLTLDLRQDNVRFAGEAGPARAATECRSRLESALEQMFLERITKKPSNSAFSIFSSISEDYPNSVDRRLRRAQQVLSALKPGEKAHFAAAGRNDVKATVERTAQQKLRLTAGAIRPEFAQALAATEGAIRLPAGKPLDEQFDEAAAASGALEVALAGQPAEPPLGPGFVLDVRLELQPLSLVAGGAGFSFRWGEGDSRTEQDIRVVDCKSGLSLEWRVHAGLRPAKGKRVISAAALDLAAVHNPWYLAGETDPQEATSFVVSRAVYAALKAGKAAPIGLCGRYGANDDHQGPRPVEWQGELQPAGEGEITVKVNNRDEKLRVLRAKLGDDTVAFLDDARFPVGMADRLVEVHTTIRCLLVDQRGAPVPGARGVVEDVELESRLDGILELAPRPGKYGKLTLQITLNELQAQKVEVDLSAPGLSPVKVTVDRPLTELLWLEPSQAAQLDALPVSDQVKRHARRDLQRGRCVLIPSRMVGAWPRRTIAYYAYEPECGYSVGIMEHGLCGADPFISDHLMDEFKKAAEEKLEEGMQEKLTVDPMAAFHCFRGAVISWWVYSAYRVEGDSHTQAVLRALKDMEYWADQTDFFHHAGQEAGNLMGNEWAGGQAADQLRELASKAIFGAGSQEMSKKAFMLGYVCGLLYLASELGEGE